MTVGVTKHLPLRNGFFNHQLIFIKALIVFICNITCNLASSWRFIRVKLFYHGFVDRKPLVFAKYQVGYPRNHTDKRSNQQESASNCISPVSFLCNNLFLSQHDI